MTELYSVLAFLTALVASSAQAAEMPKCNAQAWTFLKYFQNSVASAPKNDCSAAKINGNQDVVQCLLVTDTKVTYQIVMDKTCDTLLFVPTVVSAVPSKPAEVETKTVPNS